MTTNKTNYNYITEMTIDDLSDFIISVGGIKFVCDKVMELNKCPCKSAPCNFRKCTKHWLSMPYKNNNFWEESQNDSK